MTLPYKTFLMVQCLKRKKTLNHSHANFWLKKMAIVKIQKILEPTERKACSFERIYFSRGSWTRKFIKNAKELGRLIFQKFLKLLMQDIKKYCFFHIPNTGWNFHFLHGERSSNLYWIKERRTDSFLGYKNKQKNNCHEQFLMYDPRIEKGCHNKWPNWERFY